MGKAGCWYWCWAATGSADGRRPCTCPPSATTWPSSITCPGRDIDQELGVQSLTPIPPLPHPAGRLGRAQSGQRHRLHTDLTLGQRLRRTWSPCCVSGLLSDALDPLRRAARSALFDEVGQAQALHRQQQPQRHQRRAGRHRGEPAATSTCVHLGTMGVYGYGTAGAADSGGLSEGEAGHARTRPASSARSSTPSDPGSIYHMTKTQDALLFQFYAKNDKAQDHRSASGHRLGCPDRRDPRCHPAPGQPLRLRWRLRYGAEPLPRSRRQLGHPADRPRHRRPDPRLHQHPGHRALRPSWPWTTPPASAATGWRCTETR